MQLTLFEFVSTQFHLQLSNQMSIANPISFFASAPKPWAAFTNTYATISSVHLISCSMNLSLLSLPASPRVFSTILSMKIKMMTSVIPTPIYLLYTPTIQPISLNFSKKMFVQFQYQCNSKRHRH